MASTKYVKRRPVNENGRRVIKTKQGIRDSFFILLKEKPINKITVSDIIRQADINRSTFYFYYDDIFDMIEQINNSKKWPSLSPETDNNGNVLLRQNGKPLYARSYSILQDEIFQYLRDKGYADIERGVKGSTAANIPLQKRITKLSQLSQKKALQAAANSED